MAAVVATMLVRPLVKIVMQKVSSSLLGQYKVMKGMEEQHEILKRRLPAILDVMADAEQEATHREGAAAWLEAVKKVSYEASEVFDEFKYEALRRKARKEGHYKELGFSVVKLFPTHNRFVFRDKMGKKLRKVVRAIEVLVTETNAFGFQNQPQQPASYEWRQTDHDLFDPKKTINRYRAEDNKNIIEILVSRANSADLTVVPIVGMGGLGKTTLAQLVYDEPEIEKHFDLLLWITTASKKKSTSLDSLQNVVRGKRYLLVLNDVKREIHNWDKLEASLQHGGMGSAVLTTTRDEGVAEIMGNVETYNLAPLEDKFIKEIIETRAFSSFQKEEERPAELVNMVDEIVKRCVGSPLAATALGSVLRTKNSEEEWKVVSSRSNICTEETDILPILRLSYNELPSHMKQCFSFCAIFPKGYEIDVDKLIQLWIAHGFIQEKQVRLKTIGRQTFDELASRYFFQDVKQVNATNLDVLHNGACYYSRTTCKIHDLMHDVALSVIEKECASATKYLGEIESVVPTVGPTESECLPDTVRHLFLSCKDLGKKLNGSLENCSAAIQTLLCDKYSYIESPLQHLSKYRSLKALQLCRWRSSFPLKPKHVHHLRYLDLSRSGIVALPEDMGILYNLQTLNLSYCRYLGRLPEQMKYMTALRYLYTHGCSKLKSMPKDLRKLTSLETLTCFVAGSDSNCSNVGELGNLNLGDQLELCHLENVKVEDAEAANLVNKKELRELTLEWSVGSDNVADETCCDDGRVLEKLKPHVGLHAIKIHSYKASTFPIWMATLQNIVEVHLIGCNKLQWLFSRDCGTSFAFPNLKELKLKYLDRLEGLWECIEYNTETLAAHEYGLKEVLDSKEKCNDHDFPLESLALSGFNTRVTELCGCFVHLQYLRFCACDAFFYWPEKEFQGLISLRILHIFSCKNLTGYAQALVEPSTSSEARQLLPRLETLAIRDCDSLVEVFDVPASLREIVIDNCSKLGSSSGRRLQQGQSASSIHQGSSSVSEVSSPSSCHGLTGGLHLPPSLKVIDIMRCHGLTSLESRSGELPLLERLTLGVCNTLSSLPDGPQAYSSLQFLCIAGCLGLKTLPTSLQQRLGSIREEYIHSRYYEVKQKKWKYAIRRD
ncbi:unnamed protein product [Alopecurus aequalis]